MSFRVLIAEDEPKLLEVLCDYFLSHQREPVPASDGEKPWNWHSSRSLTAFCWIL